MKKKCLLFILCVLFANVAITANTKKAGYLNVASSVNAIGDDDEKAAAQWFTSTYGGDYIPVSEIGAIDLSQYGVLWIYVDNENGLADAPDAIYAVADELNDYYKAGGNLLLTTYANNLLQEFGRTNMWPDIVGGAGPGSENPDPWSITAAYGTWDPEQTVVDRSQDPIFDGLTTSSVTRDNGNEYTIITLIGPGWKEDHNCFWSMDITDNVIPNDQISKLTTWESTYNATTLGTWGHVQDYFGAGLVRWHPTEDHKGTCITIGFGAYEWSIKDGTNPYQNNIEGLTKNALDELLGKTSGIKYLDVSMKVLQKDNLLSFEQSNGIGTVSLFDLRGSFLQSFDKQSIQKGIDISNLTNGLYILKIYDNLGNPVALHKFIK